MSSSISGKYHMSAQLDKQQKNQTLFVGSFTNSTSMSVEVDTNRFKFDLSLADKRYVSNN